MDFIVEYLVPGFLICCMLGIIVAAVLFVVTITTKRAEKETEEVKNLDLETYGEASYIEVLYGGRLTYWGTIIKNGLLCAEVRVSGSKTLFLRVGTDDVSEAYLEMMSKEAQEKDFIHILKATSIRAFDIDEKRGLLCSTLSLGSTDEPEFHWLKEESFVSQRSVEVETISQ